MPSLNVGDEPTVLVLTAPLQHLGKVSSDALRQEKEIKQDTDWKGEKKSCLDHRRYLCLST